MEMTFETEAALTAQNQITVPATVRQALKLRGGKSRLKFQILPEEGRVLVTGINPFTASKEDPALKPFLHLLAKDIENHPGRLKPFPIDLRKRTRKLIAGVKVDLNGPLTGKD